jgi:dephospho-CoA kinase
VTRILITGMSGTGKSSVVLRLRELGYRAIDMDDGWPALVEPVTDETGGIDWIWREDVVDEALSSDDAVVFIAGAATNQPRFYPRFDHIVLLSAPADVMAERLRTRTTNPYGKRPEELALALHYKRTVEPAMRRSATIEIDTTAPLDDVVARILALLPAPHDS